MNKPAVRILIFLVLIVNSVTAQVGVKVSQLAPYGDIGEYFNKAPAYEVFAVLKEDNFRERFGILYSHLTPRIDTMPVYAVQVDPGTGRQTVIPGFLNNRMLTFAVVTADFGYRIINIKHKFFLYGAAGIVAGKSHTEYTEVLQTVSETTANSDVIIAGFKLCGDIEYKLSGHVELFAEYTYNGLVDRPWTTHYTNTLASIGIYVSLKPFDD